VAKTKLYIDIDDTILADCYADQGMDFRPAVLTQVEYLSRMFDTYWLTHWSEHDLDTVFRLIYSEVRLRGVKFAHWRDVNPIDKAPYVLANGLDFYWLEDPLSTGDLDELASKGVADRYIPVAPSGMWGFTRAINQLFTKADITSADLKKIEAPAHLFKEPCADHFDWTFYE
jgi:hypothetical protein